MKSRDELSFEQQATFGDGGLQVDEEIDTDLGDWGIVDEEQERPTRYEVEEAREFGVDDRTVTKQAQTKQGELFVSVEDDQVTLSGEDASNQSRWE